MKIAFVSNYFNHHQQPFSDEMYRLIGDDYRFIETSPITQERLSMGWGIQDKPSYVKNTFESDLALRECEEIILSADAVIIGSAPKRLERMRLNTGKLTIKYSERIFKPIAGNYKIPLRIIKNFIKYKRYKNAYLLCASAYTSADYSHSFLFKDKAFKWGYFPRVYHYDNLDDIIKSKENNSILWVARFLELKHPEVPILVAERLKKEGYRFHLNLIGSGVMQSKIAEMIKTKNLQDCVSMLGVMKPEEVRSYMEKSQIFLFTSDFNEGWGAVLNESMNSACATVSSHAIGSVPYLIDDGTNGFIYKNGDIDDIFSKVKYLLDHPEKTAEFGKKAYETLTTVWNAEVAAKRTINLIDNILNNHPCTDLYESGPCSKAEILGNNWYKKK